MILYLLIWWYASLYMCYALDFYFYFFYLFIYFLMTAILVAEWGSEELSVLFSFFFFFYFSNLHIQKLHKHPKLFHIIWNNSPLLKYQDLEMSSIWKENRSVVPTPSLVALDTNGRVTVLVFKLSLSWSILAMLIDNR